MAKFKVGDRVKILNVQSLNIYERHFVDYQSVIEEVYNSISAPTVYKLKGIRYFYTDRELELVEPEKEEAPYKKPLIFSPFSKHDIYVNGKVGTYGVEAIEHPCNMPHEPKRLRVTFIEHTEKLPSQEVPKVEPKQDEAFKLDEHEFGKKVFDGIREMTQNGFEGNTLLIPKRLVEMFGLYKTEKPIKNRIPDRVVFNEDKGKVTVLISKMNDGEAPYRSYTSKVNVEGGDKYDAQFGFLLSYYKYLIRRLGAKEQKELIERIFRLLPTKRYPYLLGAVETEVMKLSDVFMTYKDWEELYVAITEPCEKGNGTWDYAEWKEMLRVHELETKREKQREVNKEIKKHQKEIDRLKKEV